MPPLALISSIAIRAPSRKLVDDTAPAPDNSPMKANFTGPDCASALPATAVASAAASRGFFIRSSLIVSFGRERLGQTLLRLVALGDDCVEGGADTLARG